MNVYLLFNHRDAHIPKWEAVQPMRWLNNALNYWQGHLTCTIADPTAPPETHQAHLQTSDAVVVMLDATRAADSAGLDSLHAGFKVIVESGLPLKIDLGSAAQKPVPDEHPLYTEAHLIAWPPYQPGRRWRLVGSVPVWLAHEVAKRHIGEVLAYFLVNPEARIERLVTLFEERAGQVNQTLAGAYHHVPRDDALSGFNTHHAAHIAALRVGDFPAAYKCLGAIFNLSFELERSETNAQIPPDTHISWGHNPFRYGLIVRTYMGLTRQEIWIPGQGRPDLEQGIHFSLEGSPSSRSLRLLEEANPTLIRQREAYRPQEAFCKAVSLLESLALGEITAEVVYFYLLHETAR